MSAAVRPKKRKLLTIEVSKIEGKSGLCLVVRDSTGITCNKTPAILHDNVYMDTVVELLKACYKDWDGTSDVSRCLNCNDMKCTSSSAYRMVQACKKYNGM